MAATIAVMSAGDGYSYFMKSVATGDVDRSMSTPLTRYYTETGTPPGRWLGSGVASLGSDELGRLLVGDLVTEEQMARLVGKGLDPITGEQLGRAYPVYGKGKGGKSRRAVAGYDFTFSLPKSASILWGVSDAGIQEQIVAVHRAAVVKVFEFMEHELAATRTGASVAGNATSEAGEGGAVAQVDVTGLIAMFVRSLGLADQRPAPAHPRRGLQQGQDAARREVAVPGRARVARRDGRDVRAARSDRDGRPDPHPRRGSGNYGPGPGRAVTRLVDQGRPGRPGRLRSPSARSRSTPAPTN